MKKLIIALVIAFALIFAVVPLEAKPNTNHPLGEKPQATTLIIAASDSFNKERADYICDGTDDQETINLALDSVVGKVVLREGHYDITDSILPSSGDALQGMGNSTILKIRGLPEANIYTIWVTDVSGIAIENLFINGDRDNFTGGEQTGITLNRVNDFQVAGVTVENMRIFGIQIASCENGILFGNTVRTSGLSPAEGHGGFNINGCSSVSLSGNIAENNMGYGYQIHGSLTSSGVTLTGNVGRDNEADGLNISYASDVVVTGFIAEGNWYGIYTNRMTESIISNCVIRDNDDEGIVLDNSTYNVVSGNKISQQGGSGIEAHGASYHNNIVGNVIYDNNQRHLGNRSSITLVNGASWNYISNNLCRGENEWYGITIKNSESEGNIISHNDLRFVGIHTPLNDEGTLTIIGTNWTG